MLPWPSAAVTKLAVMELRRIAMLATWRPLRTVSQPPCQCSARNKPAFSHRNVNSSFRMRRGQQLFACDSNNKCFRDLAARHCAFADVECADLGRERWRTIIANLLVTNRAGCTGEPTNASAELRVT